MRKFFRRKAQASIELIFAMIVMVMMVYAVLKVASWAGLNMVKVQEDHENTFGKDSPGITLDGSGANGPMGQMDTYFYKPKKIGAAWLDY